MNHLSASLCLLLGSGLHGQVDISVPIRFTGMDGDRRIEGLAEPSRGDAAISVDILASGTLQWAVPTIDGDTLRLVMQPPVEELADGLLVRFSIPPGIDRLSWLSVDGNPAGQAIRQDGGALDAGAAKPGSVAEVLFNEGKWIVLNANHRTCPPGTIGTSGRVCMDVGSVPGLLFYDAVEHCAARGGKLCTWDEYAVGCATRQDELAGLFNEWEWIDDTSNHTHSANQAGRFTCQSQRSANVSTLVSGDTRCCYQTR